MKLFWHPHSESNQELIFRRYLLYPFNYEGSLCLLYSMVPGNCRPVHDCRLSVVARPIVGNSAILTQKGICYQDEISGSSCPARPRLDLHFRPHPVLPGSGTAMQDRLRQLQLWQDSAMGPPCKAGFGSYGPKQCLKSIPAAITPFYIYLPAFRKPIGR